MERDEANRRIVKSRKTLSVYRAALDGGQKFRPDELTLWKAELLELEKIAAEHPSMRVKIIGLQDDWGRLSDRFRQG